MQMHFAIFIPYYSLDINKNFYVYKRFAKELIYELKVYIYIYFTSCMCLSAR